MDKSISNGESKSVSKSVQVVKEGMQEHVHCTGVCACLRPRVCNWEMNCVSNCVQLCAIVCVRGCAIVCNRVQQYVQEGLNERE